MKSMHHTYRLSLVPNNMQQNINILNYTILEDC